MTKSSAFDKMHEAFKNQKPFQPDPSSWEGFKPDSDEQTQDWIDRLGDLKSRPAPVLEVPARPELTRIEKMNRFIEIAGITARTFINDGYKEMRKENYFERAHTHQHVVMVWINGAVGQDASHSVVCTKDTLEDAEVDAFCIAAKKLLGKVKFSQIISEMEESSK